MNALSVFAAAAEAPAELALITEHERFTFAELAERCQGHAEALRRHAKPVAFRAPLTLETLLWIYAAAATATPFLPLNPRLTEAEAESAIARSGATLPPSPIALPEPAGARAGAANDPEAAFSWILTSGSSGNPKLVELSRRAVVASAAASEQNLGTLPADRWLLCLPLSHVSGLSIVVRMLCARRAVVLFEPSEAGLLARIPELVARLEREQITLASLVPSVLERLLDADFRPAPSLRAVVLGGAGCRPNLARRATQAQVPLLTSYGLSESASQVVTRRYEERYLPLAERGAHVSSGHPLPGVELSLFGERIGLRSPSLFSGYVGAEASGPDEHGFFLTADRGALGENGELYVLGRRDTMLVTGGENVDPEEVEAALSALPYVAGACVFGLPSPEFGELVVAVLVGQGASKPPLERVQSELATRLSRFKLPRGVAWTEALPLTSNGKLDRARCAELFSAEVAASLAAPAPPSRHGPR